MIKFTDRDGQVTTYTYGALNRLTFSGFSTTTGTNGTTYANTIAYSYDVGNRLIQAVDSIAGKVTFTRSYDGLDRLAKEPGQKGQ